MAGGGRVLLHDEDAGAHATDGELLVALDPDLVHGQICDGAARRAVAQEGDERLDSGRGALRVHGHGAVVFVAHPAHDAQLTRAPPGALPEPDALDGATENRADRPGAGVREAACRPATVTARARVLAHRPSL